VCPAIDIPASCEIRAIIRFVYARNMSAANIHHELWAMVYSQNVMNEELSDNCVECSKMGEQIFTMNGIVSDDLVQSVGQKICERWHFTISELLCEFPQISCTVLYDIIIVRQGFHKFCTKWVAKMLMYAHKMQRMASALTFFTVIPQRWR
jgi:hypothetical protein